MPAVRWRKETVYQIFDNPSHPYTLGLLNSLPSNEKYQDATRLEAIPGTVPDLLTLGEGCPFANRCKWAGKACGESFPEETVLEEGHTMWCHYTDKVKAGKGE